MAEVHYGRMRMCAYTHVRIYTCADVHTSTIMPAYGQVGLPCQHLSCDMTDQENCSTTQLNYIPEVYHRGVHLTEHSTERQASPSE